jgi:hypothetical protein
LITQRGFAEEGESMSQSCSPPFLIFTFYISMATATFAAFFVFIHFSQYI